MTTDRIPAVRVEGVSCRFGGRWALRDLSFDVPAGEIVGILGANGAGKTTLVDVLCGLVRPHAGRVTVLGHDVLTDAAAVRARIGVLAQETALYEELTPLQNLRFAADLYGVADGARRIEEMLALVGLEERRRDAVSTFSGGMKRRLAIARALLHDPALLILDEPTLGVDLEARHAIWAHVRSLRSAGRTVVLTTNHLDEAEALCDRVAILRDGRRVAEDTPARLSARAGRCLEVQCAPEAAAVVAKALRAAPGVLRVAAESWGVVAHVDTTHDPETLLRHAREAAPVHGFRTRAPDLVEVFQALTAAGTTDGEDGLAVRE